MKLLMYLVKLLMFSVVAVLFAMPAVACDMHGMFGGGDDGYGVRSWLTDDELEAERKQAIAVARAALVAQFRGLTADAMAKPVDSAQREQPAKTPAATVPDDTRP